MYTWRIKCGAFERIKKKEVNAVIDRYSFIWKFEYKSVNKRADDEGCGFLLCSGVVSIFRHLSHLLSVSVILWARWSCTSQCFPLYVESLFYFIYRVTLLVSVCMLPVGWASFCKSFTHRHTHCCASSSQLNLSFIYQRVRSRLHPKSQSKHG